MPITAFISGAHVLIQTKTQTSFIEGARVYKEVSGSVSLVIQNAVSAHQAQAISLGANLNLLVADSFHGQASNLISLGAQIPLSIAHGFHAPADTAPVTPTATLGLTIQSALSAIVSPFGPFDLGLSPASSQIGLTSTIGPFDLLLPVNSATHSQSAEALGLLISFLLAVNSAEHAVSSTFGAFDIGLPVDSGQHSHQAVEPDLQAALSLLLQDSNHALTSSLIDLLARLNLTIDNGSHDFSSDQLRLIFNFLQSLNPIQIRRPGETIVVKKEPAQVAIIADAGSSVVIQENEKALRIPGQPYIQAKVKK